ncbi:HNH endonuclease [Achromobacter kerstersii]
MTLEKRFAIIDGAGRPRFPYLAATGEGKGHFVLRTGSGTARRSIFVKTIEEVIQGAVIDGYRLRVRTDDELAPKDGSLSLHGGHNVRGYTITPDLAHLVASASLKPIAGHEGHLTNFRSELTSIVTAREFIMDRVQRPALSCSNLRPEIKDKVKHSDIWLQKFKRIGDLYNYLARFSEDKSDAVYLEMKACGLLTFEDIKLEFADRFRPWLNDCTRASDFVIGESYSPHDILIFTKNYDTRAGGMFVVPASGAPSLVVIKATLSGGAYANEWLETSRRLKYYFKAITRNGKQEFGEHFKPNAAILQNPSIPILTFVRTSDSTPFMYQGAFTYANHYAEPDGSRWFELALCDAQPADVVAEMGFLETDLKLRVAAASASSRADRLARLHSAPKTPPRVIVRATAFIRNADVIVEVLQRAQGHCEGCQQPAPFISKAKNEPYLEVHHKVRLADGGDDTVDNAIALCPNCHREMHFG